MRWGRWRRPGQATVVAVLGVVVIAAIVPLVLQAMAHRDEELWGGVFVAVALVAVSVPLLYVLGQRQLDDRVVRLLLAAVIVKLLAAIARYYVAFEVYGGTADATMYVTWGTRLAESFSQGVFDVDVGRGQFFGTGFMRYVSGLAALVTGPSGLAAFFFFAWLSFWGSYAFFRAFQIAVPDGHHVRYGVLLFFMPSLLYWPASIGKEAWMMLVLGLMAYGASKVLTRRPRGYLPLAAGLAGVVMMRPHIAALACLALAAGYLRRTSKARPPLFGPAPQVVGLALLAVATFFVLDQVERYFELDEEVEIATGAEAILAHAEERTSIGGSAFQAERVRTPLDLPGATVTVLLRPFPWEAENRQMLLAAAESLLLTGLLLVSWQRVWAGVRRLWANPYLRYGAVFILGFVVAYASVGNFGILARQRAQLYPLLLMFLAVPPGALVSGGREAEAAPRGASARG